MIKTKRVLNTMKSKLTIVSCMLIATLILVCNVSLSSADEGIPVGTRNADGDITYGGVVYSHEDIKYWWDISETIGGGKIFAYYFRDDGDASKYDGGTVIIMDVDPSADPSTPNRLMTFNDAVYFNGSMIKYKYGNINSDSNFNSFDDHRTQSLRIATPFSAMCEDSLLNGENNVVYKVIVANKVHSGKDMCYLFAGLRCCKEFDLRNLSADYEYMLANNTVDGEIFESLFSYANNCTIKMFDGSSYLKDSCYGSVDLKYYPTGGIILDFSDVNMNFTPSYVTDIEGVFEGLECDRIYVPKSLSVLSGMQIIINNYLDRNNKYGVWTVYDNSDKIIGYSDHLIGQDSNEFDGTPSYMVPSPDILPYYSYNKYVTLTDEVEKQNALGKFVFAFTFNISESLYENKWIEEETLVGEGITDSHLRYFPIEPNIFSQGMLDYIKYYLESKLGIGNYTLDFSKAANFDYDKANDTNNDPFHLVYLAINEYAKKALHPEIELSSESTTFTYLDKLNVNAKDVSGTPLDAWYNVFLGNNEVRDVKYYTFDDDVCDTPLTSTQMTGLDILENGTVTDEGDYYKYSYFIDASSEKLDGTNYMKFGFTADYNISPKIELTFTNMKHQSLINIDYSDGSAVFGGWYQSWENHYDDHCYIEDADCDVKEEGLYSYYFNFYVHDFIDDEGVTVDIRIPKRQLYVSDEEYIKESKYGNTLTLPFGYENIKDFKELDDYYVVQYNDVDYLDQWIQFDFEEGDVEFYYGNTPLSIYDLYTYQTIPYAAPEGDTSTFNIQTDITNDNVESLISSNKFDTAYGILFTMDGMTGVMFMADENGILIIPKKFPIVAKKDGSTFEIVMNKLGDNKAWLRHKAFTINDITSTYVGSFTVNPFSIEQSNADISFKFKKGDREESSPFNLPVDETNGSTYDSVTAYKKINTGEIVKIPDEDIKVEVTNGNTKGPEETEITLKVSGNSENVTGFRTFTYKISNSSPDPNPPSPPGGGGGGGGGGSSIVSSPKVTFTLHAGNETLNKELIKQNENELKNIKFTGNKVDSLPDNLTRDGYIFDGWYKDKDFKEKVNVGDYLQGTVTLYAKWTENKINENFIPYMIGYDDGEFKPNKALTRAETATIIARLSDSFEEGKNYGDDSFTDTKKNFWYSNYIKFSQDNKLFEGYPDGEFKPDRIITRGELVKVLVSFSKLTLSEEETKNIKTFVDIKDNDFFKEQANLLLTKGLLKGYEDGSFNGNAPVTRAEAVTMINRILEFLYGKIEMKDEKVTFRDIKETDWFYLDVVRACLVK